MHTVAVAVLASAALVGWSPPGGPPVRGRRPRRTFGIGIHGLGAGIRRRLPGHRYLELVSDKALVAALPAMAVSLLVAPPAALLVPLVVIGWSMRQSRRAAEQRAHAHVRAQPETFDLLALAVGSGLTPRLAVKKVSAWVPSPYDLLLAEVNRRAAAGESFADALDHLRSDVPVSGRPVLGVLLSAERDGAPLLPALERAGQESRRQRRVAAETRARAVPVAMLLPLVVCVLPAFVLLTVVPLLVSGVSALELPG